MKKLHQLTGKTTSWHQNGRIKFTNINLKYKWAKCPNQKTQIGKLDKKPRPISVLFQETHLTCKDTHQLKIKGWMKIYQANAERERDRKKSRGYNPSLWWQKIKKDIQDSDLDRADIIDIYRPLHPKTTEYTCFSPPHCTYSKIDHIIGSKTLLSKFKWTESITVSQTTVQSN